VKSEMDIPSKLLEHVAMRISRRLLNDFPLIEVVEIKLEKRNPPMGADIDSAGVEMVVQRP
jgi:dihydroneopterin aldolase